MTSGENSEIHSVGPEFCGGALSKGGNMIVIESDNVGGLIQSKAFERYSNRNLWWFDKNISIEYALTIPYIFR